MKTLREQIAAARAAHNHDSSIPFEDEDLINTILDYHSSMGSVLDFSQDDMAVCIENGFAPSEIADLCDEKWFTYDAFPEFVGAWLEDWKLSCLDRFTIRYKYDTEIPVCDLHAAVTEYYTWHKKFDKMEEDACAQLRAMLPNH